MLIRKLHFGLCGGLLLLCACEALERNNLLDPRNPRSERQRVTLVEAFVNDATPFSPFALTALDSLSSAFSADQILIVEHHLPSANYADAHALPESADRYRDLAAADRGVPDVFFNGSALRLQGASDARNASTRYRGALQTAHSEIAYLTIEARKNILATTIEIDATFAPLGNNGLSAFAVQAMVWEDLGPTGHHHVVRKVFSPEIFSGIAAGETRSVRFEASLLGVRDSARLQAAVMIEHNTDLGKEVLQAALAE